MKFEDITWTICTKGYGVHALVDSMVVHKAGEGTCCIHLLEGDGSIDEAQRLLDSVNKALRKYHRKQNLKPRPLSFGHTASHHFCELARPAGESTSTMCVLFRNGTRTLRLLLEVIEETNEV